MTSSLRPTARSPLLVISGTDRPVTVTEQGRRTAGGATDLWRLLGEKARFDELHLDPRFLKQPGRPDFSPYRCVLNVITDPDQNKEVLVILRKLLREFSGPVINPPDAVLRSTRDQVAGQLAGIDGLRVPRTIRLRVGKPKIVAQAVARAGLAFPVIVRVAGMHMGNIVGLVQDMDELQAALAGDGPHILTEYVDFRSDDGLYRKYRAYFFGERVILRHMIIADGWNIHVRDRARFMAERPALLTEEQAMFARADGAFPPAIHAMFKAVRARMALDYFGMDFGMKAGGEAVLFEANATMNFFPLFTDPRFAYVEQCLAPARAAFRDMVREGLRYPSLA
ncbi:MAG: hypothetical protein ABIS23_03490 [Sphingomicrobium sp.]